MIPLFVQRPFSKRHSPAPGGIKGRLRDMAEEDRVMSLPGVIPA